MEIVSSSSESLTSRSTESMEIDTLSVMENSPPRSDTPLNGFDANGDGANLMSTDTEKSITVTAPSMDLADRSVAMNDYDDADEEVVPEQPVHQKRKRTSTLNYEDASYSKFVKGSPVVDAAPVKRGKVSKNIRGVIIGVWRDSDQPNDDDKHAIYGFIDIHDRLRTRIYDLNRKGKQVFGNAPTGAGGCWVTFERVIFDSHLRGLSPAEIKEYVKIRSEKPNIDDLEELREADDKAVLKAKAIVAEQELANPTTKPVVHRTSLGRKSLNRQSLPHQSVSKVPSFQAVNTANMQSPKTTPYAEGKPNGVLIGYWEDSDEFNDEDKHAVYGVLSDTDCFRVKVQRVTRDGRFVDGNFPIGAGALWVSYKKVVLDPHLASLSRLEVKEYCRIRQREQENKETDKERKANEVKAAHQAKRVVAEQGMDNGVNVAASPDVEPRHSARSEHRIAARKEAEADELARIEKAEAREKQQEKTRKEVAIAEALNHEKAQMELKNNIKKLNKVWVAQQAATSSSTAATPEIVENEVKYHNGIKYERKPSGPFQGKLVSQPQILNIDGEDYVEYRMLTKPSF